LSYAHLNSPFGKGGEHCFDRRHAAEFNHPAGSSKLHPKVSGRHRRQLRLNLMVR
jgi:hypothetical protein